MIGPESRVLVTGSTGLVGNNVVRALLNREVSVRVLVRPDSDPRPLAGLDTEIRHGDIRDPDSVRSAVEGTTHVIHSAALVKIGGKDLERFREVNVLGTRHVATAAREAGARLVHVSTTDTVASLSPIVPADEGSPFDEEHATSYSITKYEAEKEIAELTRKGLDAVVVNPSFMLGPWDWMPSSGAMLLAVGRGLGRFAPRGYCSLVDVRDVVDGILSAAVNGISGRRYILSGAQLSYLEAWRLFAAVTGRRPPFGELGPVATRACGWAGDLAWFLTRNESTVNSAALRAASCLRHYTSRRAEVELGFRRRDLQTTVEDAWEWFRTRDF